MSYRPTLLISAPCSSRSGYGDHARDIAYSLIEQDKYDITILDQRWGSCPRTELQHHPELKAICADQITVQPDIFVQITVPNEFQRIGKHVNVGITAGIETDRVSPAFIEGSNRMDVVIVPSKHSKDVLLNTEYTGKNQHGQEHQLKCTVPVETVFEGLDLDIYNTTAQSDTVDDFMKTIKENFVFLFVGHWLQGEVGHDRKDVARLVNVFARTFRDTSSLKRPALLLKTGKAGFSRVDEHWIVKQVNKVSGPNAPSIYFLHGDLTQDEMAALYNHGKIKSMVSFTKGEGFGRPLLEFSATGKPTIASGWSGHTDFLNKHAILLPGQLHDIHRSAVQKGMLEEGSKWFYVDENQAHLALKEVHSNYKKVLKTTSKQKSYVKSNFSIEKADELLAEVFDKYTANIPEPVELKLPKLELPKLEKV